MVIYTDLKERKASVAKTTRIGTFCERKL